VWLLGHHVDKKGTECGLCAIMWMTKAPSVIVGHVVLSDEEEIRPLNENQV
jgi:hypothetical protein